MIDIPVLIIGYQRLHLIEQIVATALENSSGKIYVSIDAPRDSNTDSANIEIRNYLNELVLRFPNRFSIRFLKNNVGCAIHVLTACDWFFSHERFGLVLEDDCLPSAEVFKFLFEAKLTFDHNPKCLMVCLSQFCPNEITLNRWSFSPYPLVWGWAASDEKWITLRTLILGDFKFDRCKIFKSKELYFWHSGARRAHKGLVDAWDTPLVFGMVTNGYFVLHPPVNLIQNLGADTNAVHVKSTSPWINRQIEPYSPNIELPQFNPKSTIWYSVNFYRIRNRHVLTNRMRLVLDYLKLRLFPVKSLTVRYLSQNLD